MTNYPCLRLINNNSAVTACAQSNQGAWLCSQYTDGYVPNECVYFATGEKEAAVSPRVWWSAKLNPVKGLQKGNTDSVLRWYWSISVAKELCALQSEQHIAWMNMGYDSMSATVKIKIVIQLFIKLNRRPRRATQWATESWSRLPKRENTTGSRAPKGWSYSMDRKLATFFSVIKNLAIKVLEKEYYDVLLHNNNFFFHAWVRLL